MLYLSALLMSIGLKASSNRPWTRRQQQRKEVRKGVVVPGRFGRPAEYFKQKKEEQKALWE